MSFHNTAPSFVTFYYSDQTLLPFKLKTFAFKGLHAFLLFILHFIVGTIMHGYNTVEHSVTGANNCFGTNYCIRC